jgi:cellulose biosynthesis protein BcsQ
MKIIAVTNIKGGVGKTTTAVNLAYLCAASGQRTLLWDLDPQGGATYVLGIDPSEYEPASAKRLLAGKCEVPELIVETGYPNLDVLPANLSYRKFDIHLSAHKKPTERLLKMSRSLQQAYDVLFLDCPPGISLLSENVLHAADVVMVPLLPTPLSLRMLIQLQAFIEQQGWQDLLLLPFFSMVDVRRSLHRELMANTRTNFPAMLNTEVPYWSEIERMSVQRAPLPAISPSGRATPIYAALWGEMSERMGARS